MQSQNSLDGLAGQLLIAMPGMGDPRFEHSVVFLCDHSADGAMGLIINKPAPDVPLKDLLTQIGVAPTTSMQQVPVQFGGPVENGRGFVLHSDEYTQHSTTLKVGGGFSMTATMDILEDIANGRGPRHCILALGYAGWGPGQLESELQQNGWLTVAATPGLVFEPENAMKWEGALRLLGIDPLMLSATGGSA